MNNAVAMGQLRFWAGLVLAVILPLAAQHKVIFDTDFAVLPRNGGSTLILPLHSPALEILGIATVAGNDRGERATSDVLRVLRIAERTEILVHNSANMPLVREKSNFAQLRRLGWRCEPLARRRGRAENSVAARRGSRPLHPDLH